MVRYPGRFRYRLPNINRSSYAVPGDEPSQAHISWLVGFFYEVIAAKTPRPGTSHPGGTEP